MLEVDASNRKEQKKREAEARQKNSAARRPLEQKLAELESKIKGLTAERDNIESWMGKEEAYSDDNKPQLQEMLKRQGEVVAEIAELEWKWFEVQQKLETAG